MNKPTGTLFIITAASGTGKTSLVKELLATTNDLTVSVSHTTRQPRTGESDGVHYHFVNVSDFQDLIEDGEFLEFAQVFDNYYGTTKKAVKDTLATGVDVILEIDWQGALQVKQQFTNAVMIFILPPSREALHTRLTARGQDSDEIISTRLAGAVTEMRAYSNFDYVVINDDFNTALDELRSIILANRLSITQQSIRHETLISELLSE
ncbi:MAG: guanylate kinase [Moraxella sp.]|nr:guanylate kinase [Moraxella sp.]